MRAILKSDVTILIAVIFASIAGFATASSPLERLQTIELKKGWNSVHLTVEPDESAIGKVFENTHVDRVAVLLRPVFSDQFIKDPAEEPWQKDTWRVWYSPDTVESVLSSLHAVHANQAYLVHSREASQLIIHGTAETPEIRWVADAFNLVGFSIDPDALPTFAQYFGGSKAHQGLEIYRLQGDRWSKVTNPLSTTVRRGEAYWVYCKGTSGYQGPVSCRTSKSAGIVFGSSGGNVRLTITNHGLDPAEVQLSGLAAVPLSVKMFVLTDTGLQTVRVPIGDVLKLPVLEPGKAIGLDLELRSDGSAPAGTGGAAGVVELRSDSGVLQTIPVLALTK
ncbi:MAG: hypothetical protein ACI9UA_000670 [Pseudoalteromonas tetraodonis]|jgi:hypothetical protein